MRYRLFGISTDNGKQLIGAGRAFLVGKSIRSNVRGEVLGDDFVQQPIHRAANSGDAMKNRRAWRVGYQRFLDRGHLSGDAPDPRDKFGIIFQMAH
ncbi:hypothetical protein GCM10011393_25840 [Sphingopyxis bauzanensis]|nr:hypothetical protein GCM10011393_25840 [Sphingopyxis bauzanensis]